MPLEAGEVSEFYGRGGDFVSLKKLVQPGQSVELEAVDLNKNHKTKYPIKDKDYSYRVTLKNDQGQTLLLDLNGANAIAQFMTALYPNGPQDALVPCRVKFTRRVERKMNQSEVIIERVGDAKITL